MLSQLGFLPKLTWNTGIWGQVVYWGGEGETSGLEESERRGKACVIRQVMTLSSWTWCYRGLWEPVQDTLLRVIASQGRGSWGIYIATPISGWLRAVPTGVKSPDITACFVEGQQKSLRQRNAEADSWRSGLCNTRRYGQGTHKGAMGDLCYLSPLRMRWLSTRLQILV